MHNNIKLKKHDKGRRKCFRWECIVKGKEKKEKGRKILYLCKLNNETYKREICLSNHSLSDCYTGEEASQQVSYFYVYHT